MIKIFTIALLGAALSAAAQSRMEGESQNEPQLGQETQEGMDFNQPDAQPADQPAEDPLLGQQEQRKSDQMAQNLEADVKIGTDIQDLEPVGVNETFPADQEQVIGWSRIEGAEAPIQISHVWKHNGEVLDSIPLEVDGSPFRTYSRKSLYGLTGDWTLEVQGPDGDVLASASFQVEESAEGFGPVGMLPKQDR